MRIGRLWVVLGLFVAGCLVLAGGAFAQAPAAEVSAGYAGFVDDATISHGTPRPRLVVRYVLGGAGFFRHFDRFDPHTRVAGTVGVQLGGCPPAVPV